MYNSENFKLYPVKINSSHDHNCHWKVPTVSPFCSNKTLKHFYRKFPHLLTGNNQILNASIYLD